MTDPLATLERFRKAFQEGSKIREGELAFLSMDGLREVVALEMERLRGLKEGHLESDIFDAVAVQSPALLTPYLEEILTLSQRLEPSVRASTWWRAGALPDILAALRHSTFDDSISAKARLLAWQALIASRDHDSLIYVAEHGEFCRSDASEAHGWTGQMRAASIRQYLWQGANMDWDAVRGELRDLLPDGAYHLRFEDRHEASINELKRGSEHPTWSTKRPLDPVGWHGGDAAKERCLACKHQLIDILALTEIPQDLGICSIDRLHLTVCLHCFPWPQDWLFFRHQKNGETVMLSDELAKVDPAEIPVEMEPLPRGELYLVASDARWRHQTGAYGENLFRFGGTPNWIQDAAYRACPRCDRTMPFLLQLGDDFPGHGIWGGDSGRLYVFWCDDCKISGWHCDNY